MFCTEPSAASRHVGLESPTYVQTSYHCLLRNRSSVALVIPMFNEELNIEHAMTAAVRLARVPDDYEIIMSTCLHRSFALLVVTGPRKTRAFA